MSVHRTRVNMVASVYRRWMRVTCVVVLLVILVSTVQMVRICALLFFSTRDLITNSSLDNNNIWPLLSSKNADFQNEAKFKIFLVRMSFICMTIKNHFLINGVALSLALRQRLVEIRKCPFLALKEPTTEADPESYMSFANSSTKRN